MGGVLKIFEFLNRGQRLRRGQPSEQEMLDTDLKRSLVVRGENRAELSSALSSLEKLDNLKRAGLADRVAMGGLDEDSFVRQEYDRREEDRRYAIDTRDATLKRLKQNPQDPEITIDENESRMLAEHGVHIPPGRVSASILGHITNLEGREITASGKGRGGAGPRKGQFSRLVDNTGNVIGFFNPATQEWVDNPVPGGRASGMSTGELDRRGMLNMMKQSVTDLKGLAATNKDSIGWLEGKWAGAKRGTVGVKSEVNDLFHISDNLSDSLLRARSGAQINEQEYRRLRPLVPDPRGPEGKFFDDLRRFEMELDDIMAMREQGGGVVPPVPVAPGGGVPSSPVGGDLAAQARAELARRRGRQ